MEENKKKAITITIATIVILLVGLAGIYVINSKVSGITAMEGREIADVAAQEWNTSAKLSYMTSENNIYSDGTSSCWLYHYIVDDLPEESERVFIYVYENKSYEISEAEPIIFYFIDELDMDSTEALEQAMANPQTNDWLSSRPDASLTLMVLDTNMSGATGTYWSIWWIDNETNEQIGSIVEASTGEVFFLEAK